VRADDISVVQSHRRFPDARPLNADLPFEDSSARVTGDIVSGDTGIHSTEPPMFASQDPIASAEAPITSVGTPPSGTLEGHSTSLTGTYYEDDTDNLESQAKSGLSTTTAADAEAGAGKGAAWGAGVGILAALAALAVPGFGIIVGGGALAIALAGIVGTAGAGAIAGGVTGYLKDQGVDEHVATEYEGAVSSGGAILAVTLPSAEVAEIDARMILNKYGAANVNAYPTRGYLA
jgi:hypothetical protein